MVKLTRYALTVLALSLVFPLLAPSARADSVTDTISVYVGYFGWSEDEYIEKASYHWTELDDMAGGALDTQTVIYSYYSGSRTYLVAGRGFYVRDLLTLAGIDFGSIGSIDFFTKDHANGAYRSFTKASLFDLPRYYFPNLAANEETGEIYAYDGDDIWNGASSVEAMLALEDYTEWDVPGAEFERLYDPAMMNPNARFHLFFGQSRPEEASTSSAAKYCYKLLVTFLGKPLLSTEQTDMELKIGSGNKIELTVDAEDGLLNDFVRNNITWSSGDESIISVAPDGTIEAKGAGEAVVTASFGESSVSVNVRVKEGEASSGGAAAPASSGSGIEAPPDENPAAEAPEAAELLIPEAAPVEAVSVSRVRVINAAALAGIRSGSKNAEDQSGGRMDEDSVQLTVTLPERTNAALPAVFALCASFLLGAALQIIRYNQNLGGKHK